MRRQEVFYAWILPRDRMAVGFHYRGGPVVHCWQVRANAKPSSTATRARQSRHALGYTVIPSIYTSGTAMISRETIDQLAQQIGNLFGHHSLPQDFQRNLRALIQSGLTKMDVVTREEFEAQTAVLERTRAKLDQLETQLTELAQQLGSNDRH